MMLRAGATLDEIGTVLRHKSRIRPHITQRSMLLPFNRSHSHGRRRVEDANDAVNRHIELYRSMGFKYKVQEYMLRGFAAFAKSRSEQFIRADTVLEWAG